MIALVHGDSVAPPRDELSLPSGFAALLKTLDFEEAPGSSARDQIPPGLMGSVSEPWTTPGGTEPTLPVGAVGAVGA